MAPRGRRQQPARSPTGFQPGQRPDLKTTSIHRKWRGSQHRSVSQSSALDRNAVLGPGGCPPPWQRHFPLDDVVHFASLPLILLYFRSLSKRLRGQSPDARRRRNAHGVPRKATTAWTVRPMPCRAGALATEAQNASNPDLLRDSPKQSVQRNLTRCSRSHEIVGGSGARARIRTWGLPLRRRSLYPTELHALIPNDKR